jgi:hypothetical protein
MISNPVTRNQIERYRSTAAKKNQRKNVQKTPTHSSTRNLCTLEFERAVMDGDLVKARQALKDGANPREVTFSQTAGNGMREPPPFFSRERGSFSQ